MKFLSQELSLQQETAYNRMHNFNHDSELLSTKKKYRFIEINQKSC